jgi:legumain
MYLFRCHFKTVTPKNFIDVLLGKKDAMKGVGSGKVLERYLFISFYTSKFIFIHSGPDDNVFIYFTDHGATGEFF